jgi:hypothetical protein
MTLSREVKNWVLDPKNESWQKIFLTEDQANYILKVWKSTPNAEMRSSSDGRLIEVVNRNDYRLRRIDVEQKDTSGDVWICDCGRRNAMHVWPPSKCACEGKGLLIKLQRQAEAEKSKVDQIAAISK